MGRLHIFFIAAFSIRLVTPLPQSFSDWDLLGSSDLLAYDTSSLLPADPSDGSDMFSFDSVLPADSPSMDWNSYGQASLPLSWEASPEDFTSSDNLFWDDLNYDSSDFLLPNEIATGCSGNFGKRTDGGSCSATGEAGTATEEDLAGLKDQNRDLCDGDKEPMCCSPTWMFRSRWAGGGFNMDGCVPRMYLVLGVRP